MDAPFTISLFTKAFQWVGVLADPQAVTITPRFNAQPTGQIVVPNTHRLLPIMLTEGCRVTVDYAGAQVMSGVLDSVQGDGAPDGQVTFQLRDDFGLFSEVLAWPVPGAALTAQTLAYDVRSGPAETVLKGYVQANAVARLGLPVTVATDQGRGSNIKVQARMKPLGDYLFPAVSDAGLGVSVRQVGTGLVVDCYEPSTYPLTLTPDSGIVAAWSWSDAAPNVTRTVAGGQGDGTARAFASYVDTASESTYALVREAFVDATDVDNAPDLATRAQTAQVDGQRRTGLSLTLNETRTFKYGTNLSVGDTVTEQLIPSAPARTHTLTEATLNWSVDQGFTATPAVGDIDTVDRTLAKALGRTAKRLRDLGSR